MEHDDLDRLSIEIELTKDELQVHLMDTSGPRCLATGAVPYEILVEMLKPFMSVPRPSATETQP